MQVCKNCRQVFDPQLQPNAGDAFAEGYLCSWHPGKAVVEGNAGARNDYADIYVWECCGRTLPGAVISGRDYPPRRSPGCSKGSHFADAELVIGANLAEELRSLQDRLRDIEARETLSSDRKGGVFVSYSHADIDFVDWLTSCFASDRIEYWRDEKDLLIGDVIDRSISDAIQRNTLFLLVLSPSSLNSSWVQRELDEASHEASEGRKKLLPVLVPGMNMADVPSRVRRFKCADFGGKREDVYSKLKTSIVAHLESRKNS